MKRRLFTQMRTEWRSNVWMIAELTIVGLIVALITMVLSQLAYMHSRPIGYDLTDLYVGLNNTLSEDADDYVKYDDNQSFYDDLDVILRKLRGNPYVEMVAVGCHSMPYNYNYYGDMISCQANGDTLLYFGNTRFLSPELVRALRLTGPDGQTTEQIASVLERGEWLVSPYDNPEGFGGIESCDPHKIKGKTVVLGGDSTQTAYVGDICYGIARDDYEGIYSGCIIRPLEGSDRFPSEIVVRVKPGMGRKFVESLKAKDLAQGNIYVTNFSSTDDMRDNCQRGVDNFERNLVICAVFLLVAVFLGFLGSFWFRTQQRVPEIALRKVNGATEWQIFSRLISEGLIMLLISAVIFSPIYFYLISANILEDFITFDSQLPNYVAYCITMAVLMVMIVAGIWFPARRAMKVEPANVLKDQ
jgi:putative ABC transport system permease protein